MGEDCKYFGRKTKTQNFKTFCLFNYHSMTITLSPDIKKILITKNLIEMFSFYGVSKF